MAKATQHEQRLTYGYLSSGTTGAQALQQPLHACATFSAVQKSADLPWKVEVLTQPAHCLPLHMLSDMLAPISFIFSVV